MSALAEYYESGNAPHEALGRAARRLRGGGAIYLGSGVGAERQQTPQGEKYHVTSGSGGKPETFIGPLSAVIRAFTIAGSSTSPDSPGGATPVADPAAAARLRELADEESEARNRIDRYERQLAAKAKQPWMPGRVDGDDWERRRVEELRADLRSIAAERAKLLASGSVSEGEAGKPGTNWKQVTPDAKAKLSGILAKYRKSAHPFTECVRDNTKRFGKEGAERVCAVVKDLIKKSTKWRAGGEKMSEAEEALLEGALGRLAVVEEEFGLAATIALVEGVEGAPPVVRALAERVSDDVLLLAMAGHPLACAAFGIEEAFDESKVKRDPHGRFAEKIGGLTKQGDKISMFGVQVSHSGGRGFRVSNLRADLGKHDDAFTKNPREAAQIAVGRSLASKDPSSLGGAKSYSSIADLPGNEGMAPRMKLPGAGGSPEKVAMPDGRMVQAKRDLTHHTTKAAANKARDRAAADAGYPPGARFTVVERPPDGPGKVPIWTVRMDATPTKGSAPARAGTEKPERVIPRAQAWDEAVAANPQLAGSRVSNDALQRALDQGAGVRHRVVSDEDYRAHVAKSAGAMGREMRRQAGSEPRGSTPGAELDAANRNATRVRLNPRSTMPERTAATARVKAAQDAAKAARARPPAAPAAAPNDPIERFSKEVAAVSPAQVARYGKLLDAIRKQAAVIDKGYHPNLAHVAHHVPDVKQAELTQLVRLGALVPVRQDGRTAYRLATPAEAAKARRKQLGKMGVGSLTGRVQEAFSAPAQGGGPAAGDAARRLRKKTGKKAEPAAPGAGKFDESKHKRGAAGTSSGGKFVTKGSSGEDVRAVQHRVGAKPDGQFGAKTREAVMEFQRRHGLQVDGVVGHQTAVALAGGDGKNAKVAALKDSDRAKLKRLRKGGSSMRARGRRGSAPERARGGRKV